jgi:NADH:ubiquinone oxidoreductase subunit 6 (subunit J)
VHRANLHWLVFLLPILLFIAAIWLFSVGGNIAKFLAVILIVGALVTALHAVIERRTSEFAVTNKRVLIKTGQFAATHWRLCSARSKA